MTYNQCLCGGQPELDYDSSTDYDGHSYQTASISCKDCFRSVNIVFDVDSDKERSAAEKLIGQHWNSFIEKSLVPLRRSRKNWFKFVCPLCKGWGGKWNSTCCCCEGKGYASKKHIKAWQMNPHKMRELYEAKKLVRQLEEFGVI